MLCLICPAMFSSGQFVAHHPIFSMPDGISVGGEMFESILEALEYYRDHELGKTKLESEVSWKMIFLSFHVLFHS